MAHLALAAVLVVEVKLDGTAAPGFRHRHDLNASCVQHAGGG